MIASFMDIANGGNNIGFWEKFVSGQFTDAQLKKFYPSAEATKELGKSIDERSEERRRTPGYLAGTTQRVTELAEAKVGRTIQGVLAGSLESLQKALEGVTPYMGAVVTDLREYDRERSSKTPSGEKPPYGFRTLSAPLIPVEGEYDR